jgi:hypothetical protein
VGRHFSELNQGNYRVDPAQQAEGWCGHPKDTQEIGMRSGSCCASHALPTGPLPHRFDEWDRKVVLSRSTDANIIALHSFNDHSSHETGWSRYPHVPVFSIPKRHEIYGTSVSQVLDFDIWNRLEVLDFGLCNYAWASVSAIRPHQATLICASRRKQVLARPTVLSLSNEDSLAFLTRILGSHPRLVSC